MISLTTRELMDALRNNILRDNADGNLWSDERLAMALTEAYLEFAGESLMIRDFSGNYSIVLEAGVDTYPYPAEVLSVISARVAGSQYDLLRASHTAASYGRAVMAFSTDDQHQSITFFDTPDADAAGVEVRLRVARLPVEGIDAAVPDYVCELPRQYALALTYGAAALLYVDMDADAVDPARARATRGVFDQYLARAKRYTRMAMHQPIRFEFNVPQ